MASKAEQSREGPGNGGYLDQQKRGVKRKLYSKTLEEKYKAILEVEMGQKSETGIAKMFNVPKNSLSGCVKKAESIKEGFEKFGPKRINLLDRPRLFRQAWGMVTQGTISNCFRHAKFYKDPDDDMPLATLAS